MPEKTRIRQARLEEANLLTEVTLRSKAHWQYDAAFLAATKHELEFQPGKFLPDFHVYVLEDGQNIRGFCSLIPIAPARIELHDLFVEPGYIGKGHGKRLWDHAIELARGLGFRTVVLTADPHAEPFYLRQGAIRVGEKSSSVLPGRTLPVLEYSVGG